MTRTNLLHAIVLASMTLSVFACSSPTDDSSENAEAQDNDLKKKVKPKGGNGALDFAAPGFDMTGFVGRYTFDSLVLTPGSRVEKVPGVYALVAQPQSFDSGRLMNQAAQVEITAGVTTRKATGGLRVRFAEPVTLGSTRVDLVPELGAAGFLGGGGSWQRAATGASMLVLPGNVTLTSATEVMPLGAVAVTEGALKEVIMPISHVAVALDAYDAAYPSPTNCSPPTLIGGAQSFVALATLRNQDGSVPATSFVVPQGRLAPVSVNTYGITTTQPTVAGGTNSFTLNRLEVDDVEVALASGGTQLVRGNVSVARKNADGTFQTANCTFPTHSGIDLPDGTYRVTSQAQSASGPITSTDEVTFP
jgi:hypothetical protein